MAKKLIIRDKDNQEIFYPETLSNLVHDEVTGITVESALKNNEGSNDFLELSTTDGAFNKTTLNQALSLGDVKLKKGHYPLDPGVIVDNVTLDLGGACLQSTKEKVSTPLILMQGSKPILRNGELCGNYNTADDEEGYSFYESERLVSVKLYDEALVENLDLHNCWGYALAGRLLDYGTDAIRKGISSATLVTPSSEEDRETDTFQYLSKDIDIPANYKYTCVYGGIGYGRIISEQDVKYYFYDSNDNLIDVLSEMPRVMVPIPIGATKVKAKTFTFGDFIPTYIGFFNYKCDCFTVRNCCMHNNHSLGMVGMAFGTTIVRDCQSYEHGKPRSSANSASSRSTVGFLDIEDSATPIFIMEGCTSRDEGKLAMIGAYKVIVNNCYGSVGIYRGWSANINNCVGKVSAFGENVSTLINVKNCIFYDTGNTSPNWRGINNTFIDCEPSTPSREKHFIIRRLRTNTPALTLTGRLIGKVVDTCAFGQIHIEDIATSKGSDIIIEWNTYNDSDSSSYGARSVSGDCYGIKSTCPFFPNGYTIYDSVFTPTHNFGAGSTTNNSWTGEYNNCVFNLDNGSMFYAASKKISSSDKSLIFRNCIINNTNNYLFITNMSNLVDKNYTIKFINCTIANQSKLFKKTPTDFTYEIITEDTDYDSRIKALEERIRQLEENS